MTPKPGFKRMTSRAGQDADRARADVIMACINDMRGTQKEKELSQLCILLDVVHAVPVSRDASTECTINVGIPVSIAESASIGNMSNFDVSVGSIKGRFSIVLESDFNVVLKYFKGEISPNNNVDWVSRTQFLQTQQ